MNEPGNREAAINGMEEVVTLTKGMPEVTTRKTKHTYGKERPRFKEENHHPPQKGRRRIATESELTRQHRREHRNGNAECEEKVRSVAKKDCESYRQSLRRSTPLHNIICEEDFCAAQQCLTGRVVTLLKEKDINKKMRYPILLQVVLVEYEADGIPLTECVAHILAANKHYRKSADLSFGEQVKVCKKHPLKVLKQNMPTWFFENEEQRFFPDLECLADHSAPVRMEGADKNLSLDVISVKVGEQRRRNESNAHSRSEIDHLSAQLAQIRKDQVETTKMFRAERRRTKEIEEQNSIITMSQTRSSISAVSLKNLNALVTDNRQECRSNATLPLSQIWCMMDLRFKKLKTRKFDEVQEFAEIYDTYKCLFKVNLTNTWLWQLRKYLEVHDAYEEEDILRLMRDKVQLSAEEKFTERLNTYMGAAEGCIKCSDLKENSQHLDTSVAGKQPRGAEVKQMEASRKRERGRRRSSLSLKESIRRGRKCGRSGRRQGPYQHGLGNYIDRRLSGQYGNMYYRRWCAEKPEQNYLALPAPPNPKDKDKTNIREGKFRKSAMRTSRCVSMGNKKKVAPRVPFGEAIHLKQTKDVVEDDNLERLMAPDTSEEVNKEVERDKSMSLLPSIDVVLIEETSFKLPSSRPLGAGKVEFMREKLEGVVDKGMVKQIPQVIYGSVVFTLPKNNNQWLMVLDLVRLNKILHRDVNMLSILETQFGNTEPVRFYGYFDVVNVFDQLATTERAKEYLIL
eukprot:augustus_masked-scaffold_1-processed-gene-32.61-mRNA-1 protein AED:1.00 eAED:1.00 QI:159/0/0/0/1/1/11/0/740